MTFSPRSAITQPPLCDQLLIPISYYTLPSLSLGPSTRRGIEETKRYRRKTYIKVLTTIKLAIYHSFKVNQKAKRQELPKRVTNVTKDPSFPKRSCNTCLNNLPIPCYNRSNSVVHHAAWPPSIRRSLPVMKLLALESKKTAAPRYSLGRDRRPSIFSLPNSSRRSGYSMNSISNMEVRM